MFYSLKIDLLKLPYASVKKGQDGKKYVCIPIEYPIYYQGAKGLYLSVDMKESNNTNYGTHYLKIHSSGDGMKDLSDEKRFELLPIIGNVKEANWQRKGTNGEGFYERAGYTPPLRVPQPDKLYDAETSRQMQDAPNFEPQEGDLPF